MTGGGGGTFALTGTRGTRARWVGRSVILPQWPGAPEWFRYVVLTLGMAGIQLVWSCEMAQASPYLLSLGLPKSLMSLVFLAGPLSGLIVQPVVGVLSDSCQSKFGRRRPYMVAGCAASAVSVMLLGWAEEVAAWFTSRGGSTHNTLTICLAIIAVYVIDFSINVVQAMDRSLLVDVVPPHLQPAANAWASRVFGFSACFAYYFTSLDLVQLTGGFIGSTNLKINTMFSATMLCACHAVTVVCVKERVLISREEAAPDDSRGSAAKALEEIWTTFKTMPRPIQHVMNIQFASWIGWFPILFFSTTWVAENYVRAETGSSDLSTAAAQTVELATRAGTRAMFFHSVIAFFTSIFLPPLVQPFSPPTVSSPNSVAASPYLNFSGGARGRYADREYLSSWPRLATLQGRLPTLPLKGFSLPLAWTLSNAVFAACLLSTYFATSVAGSSLIIAIAGFSWSVTNWAPFSLLGDLILRLTGSPHAAITPVQPQQHWSAQSRPRDTSIELVPSRLPSTSSGKSPMAASDTLVSLHRYPIAEVDRGELRTPSPPTSLYFDSAFDTPTRASTSRSATQDPATPPALMHGASDQRSKRISFPTSFPDDNKAMIYASGAGPLGESSSPSLHDDPYAYQEPISLGAPYGYGSGGVGAVSGEVLLVRHSDSFELDESARDVTRAGYIAKGVEVTQYGQGSGEGVTKESPDDPDGDDSDTWDLDDEDGEGGGDQAGVILGCHNLYIVAPQLLVTAFSSLVFALLSTGHSVIHGPPTPAPRPLPPRQGEEAIQEWDTLGIIFRTGGIAALLSVWLSLRLVKETRRRPPR